MNLLNRILSKLLLIIMKRCSSRKLKYLVIRILGKIGDRTAYEPLLAKLDDWKASTFAIEALGNFGDLRAVPYLIPFLCDIVVMNRREAANSLHKLGEQKWKDMIKGDDTDFIRLAKTGNNEIINELLTRIKSFFLYNNEELVNRIKNAIINQKNKIDTNLFINIIENTEEEKTLKVFAIDILGKIGDSQVTKSISKYLYIEWARKTAAQALSNLGEPFWSRYFKGNDKDFFRLSKSGNPKAIFFLTNSINNRLDNYVIAMSALEKVKHPNAINTLIEVLENDENSNDVRICVAGSLSNFRTHHADEALLDSLRKLIDKSDSIKYSKKEDKGVTNWLNDAPREGPVIAIIQALNRIDRSDVVEPLINFLHYNIGNTRYKHFCVNVRREAATALINYVKKDFSSVDKQWKNIAGIIKTPHNDHNDGSTKFGDCWHEDSVIHTDIGIGLEIPPELKM